MAYNPILPQDNSLVDAGELRNQFAGLKDLVDQRLTEAQVMQKIAQNCSPIITIGPLGLTVSDPPTQAQMQAIADRLDVVITQLSRGV